jgi:hypothetical protein
MYVNNGPTAGTSVVQNINLTVGQAYRLTFAMAGVSTSTSANSLQVNVGGQSSSFSSLAGRQWEAKSWDFVATVGPSSLRFTAPTLNGTNIDAVVLSAIPEPSTILMFGIGAFAIQITNRRRGSIQSIKGA